MNYSETLSFLFNSLPMYSRVGAVAYKANLDNTNLLMELTGYPNKKLKCIHIAGTNGKGSTSHLLASVFQEMGLKTGLYTSPHLKDFRERIRINGEMISEEKVVAFVETFKSDFDRICPSFFEMTVALAFQYFVEENVDIAIIETGLGGRLDSTNVINPILSVITNIDFDHTQLLGNSLEEIAIQKAGIIKESVPVVIGESNSITNPIFIQIATQNKAPIYFADQLNTAKLVEQNDPFLIAISIDDFLLETPLAGLYQLNNLTTLYAAIQVINKFGFYCVAPTILQRGVRNVLANTQLLGRWQKINNKPLAIADTGHNPHGLRYVLRQIEKINCHKLHFVLGMVNDKDIDAVLSMLPQKATYYFCKANIPRGLDADRLKVQASKFQLEGEAYSSVMEAYQKALYEAKADDLVFVGGSTFTVAEVV